MGRERIGLALPFFVEGVVSYIYMEQIFAIIHI